MSELLFLKVLAVLLSAVAFSFIRAEDAGHYSPVTNIIAAALAVCAIWLVAYGLAYVGLVALG